MCSDEKKMVVCVVLVLMGNSPWSKDTMKERKKEREKRKGRTGCMCGNVRRVSEVFVFVEWKVWRGGGYKTNVNYEIIANYLLEKN